MTADSITPHPPLSRDRSFHAMVTTQFLGAFNDNLFKQLLLLIFVVVAVPAPSSNGGNAPGPAVGEANDAARVAPGTPVAPANAANETNGRDDQPLPMVVFALPFVLFSGFAGYLADRYSKQRIFVVCKMAEVVITTMGLVAFVIYPRTGPAPLLCVLFLMGAHSAFFGPAKYGILPQMLRPHDLPMANGVVQMTTFLAVIFGTAAAGVLKDLVHDRLWVAPMVCVAVASVGFAASFWVRRLPAAQPGLPFQADALGVPQEIRGLLRRDRTLLAALVVYSVFWMVAGIVHPSINAFCRQQLATSNTEASIMVACLGIGIAIGCALGGAISRGRVDFTLTRRSAWALCGLLGLMAIPGWGDRPHLIGYYGSLGMMVLLGMFTGMFAVPVQVFLQARPPQSDRGRMIATQNLSTWVAILAAAGFYWLFDLLLNAIGLPRSVVFLLTGLLLLPVAVLFHPPDEALE